MQSIKLPSRFQLISSIFVWFILCWGVHTISVFQESHQVLLSLADATISLGFVLISVFLIYIFQYYSPSYINHISTRFIFTAIFIYGNIHFGRLILDKLFYSSNTDYILEKTILVRTLIIFLQISFFSGIVWFMDFIKKQNKLLEQQQISENSLRAAELNKLRQQLQPHFLFNSLNSINSLVIAQPQLARTMIQNLSDFLRGTLKKDENKLVSFSEELNLLNLYLEIEKVRFGHRLDIKKNIDAATETAFLPALLLQPILENAIKYGLYNVLEKVEITITSAMVNGYLTITVTNPFDDDAIETRKGEGFGLSIVQKRLQLLYNRPDLLKIQKQQHQFHITLQIPQA